MTNYWPMTAAMSISNVQKGMYLSCIHNLCIKKYIHYLHITLHETKCNMYYSFVEGSDIDEVQAQVFYEKMKSDFYRYLAEVGVTPQREGK